MGLINTNRLNCNWYVLVSSIPTDWSKIKFATLVIVLINTYQLIQKNLTRPILSRFATCMSISLYCFPISISLWFLKLSYGYLSDSRGTRPVVFSLVYICNIESIFNWLFITTAWFSKRSVSLAQSERKTSLLLLAYLHFSWVTGIWFSWVTGICRIEILDYSVVERLDQ